jgi:hypothetical protein
MACCKCCCEAQDGECCSDTCCKHPAICCGAIGSKECCPGTRACCGVGASQTCCPENDMCCNESCCPQGRCCGSGSSAVCCNEGQYCCNGECKDAPCHPCTTDSDCPVCKSGDTLVNDDRCCPPGYPYPRTSGSDCCTDSTETDCVQSVDGADSHCCDGQCQEGPCNPCAQCGEGETCGTNYISAGSSAYLDSWCNGEFFESIGEGIDPNSGCRCVGSVESGIRPDFSWEVFTCCPNPLP